ncbi:hypothetical protein [Halorubrum ezzemoulense]|uniref:hypothetical protein n=1 Tax=Halorubrum ezzemoulense TaxID=337243 RepID=UPI0023305F73|nr:hypothetical protein [Halorubrum ezzemoulense]MDB9252878.1 hypothetical protein [Halorubrum ezzemoulense]MDB9256738.1 hypothetical protein [Halorubrum ezzemoulense]MDB9277046.1 hypothetical protein [Halorubrum ezzemoulense]
MSDDWDLRKHTRRGALALMGIGGLLGLSETLGFTNATRSRGLNIGVSADDSAVLTITGTPNGGTKDTLNAFDENAPATPPVDITFTNGADEPTKTDGLEVDITGGTVDGSPDGDRNFTTTLSGSGDTDDSETITVDTDTGGSESVTVDVTSVTFESGTSISFSRTFELASPVTDLSTSPSNSENQTVSGDGATPLDITVTATDSDGDTLEQVDIGVSVQSTNPEDDIDVSNLPSGKKSTGSGTNSDKVTFSPEFRNTGGSDGTAKLKFTADKVSTTLTVTVEPKS